jgi:hypothetical protein
MGASRSMRDRHAANFFRRSCAELISGHHQRERHDGSCPTDDQDLRHTGVSRLLLRTLPLSTKSLYHSSLRRTVLDSRSESRVADRPIRLESSIVAEMIELQIDTGRQKLAHSTSPADLSETM